jgi:uncharacterized membrane protein YedE/YeeE
MDVTEFAPLQGFMGGALIGLAAVFMMLTIGRIAGVSGIAFHALAGGEDGRGWRIAFLAGLPLGALLVTALGWKTWGGVVFPASLPLLVAAGFIVGLGTRLGGGCTSGHGICGNANLAPRSIVATLVFMATAIVTVFLIRHVF